MKLNLHTGPDVLSPRHWPAWLALTAAAGAVNGGAFLVSERFVSHLTGTVTRLGVQGLAGDSLLALGLFVLGAMASAALLQFRVLRGRQPLYVEAFALVAVTLVVAAAAGGHDGWASLDEDGLAMLGGLAFAMGLLNATVATGTASAVRPTHLTGSATDLGVHLAVAVASRGAARHEALQWAGLRSAQLASFACGGVIMVPLTAEGGHAAFLAPAMLILLAAGWSFRAQVSGALQPGGET